jgi:hypothetical protein
VNIWIEAHREENSPGAPTEQPEVRASMLFQYSSLRISLNLGNEQDDSVATLPVFIQSL